MSQLIRHRAPYYVPTVCETVLTHRILPFFSVVGQFQSVTFPVSYVVAVYRLGDCDKQSYKGFIEG